MNIRVRCTACKRLFLRPKDRAHEAGRMHWKPYCSRACQYRMRLRGETLHCSNPGCEKIFYRARAEIQKVDKSYCSHSCSALVNNKIRPRRLRSLKQCEGAECKRTISSRARYCSVTCYSKARTVHSNSELLELLQTKSKRLGRVTTKRELGPVAYSCIRVFGSWNKALITAGLAPHRSHSDRMYKRKNTTALDGHRCDSISEALIDNWLTKNKIRHKRDVPYPNTGHKADWSIGRDVFIEYFGLAHDSPRYDRSIREKRKLCEEHNIRLIELYASDVYPVIKLESKIAPVALEMHR